jgi:membrane protein
VVADPVTISAHLDALSGLLPSEGLSIIGDQIHRLAAQGATKLGVTSIFGLERQRRNEGDI